MTDKIILELTLDELKLIDKYVELNEETKSVFDKIKYSYPQIKMTLENEGEFAVVSYNDTTYYRLMGEDSTCFCWYKRIVVIPSFPTPTLVMVDDAEKETLLEGLYYNDVEVKKEKEMIRQNLKTSLEELANGDVRPIDDVIEEAKEEVSFVPNEIKELVKEGVKWCEEHKNENPLEWLTPKTPEETAESLKEAFREAQQTEKWKEIQKKIDDGDFDDFIERTNLLDFLKDKLGYSTDSCYEIVDVISEWLPETQSADGSQNVYVECTVEGWNDCINAIRGKLQ
jgi:hypothetical protein